MNGIVGTGSSQSTSPHNHPCEQSCISIKTDDDEDQHQEPIDLNSNSSNSSSGSSSGSGGAYDDGDVVEEEPPQQQHMADENTVASVVTSSSSSSTNDDDEDEQQLIESSPLSPTSAPPPSTVNELVVTGIEFQHNHADDDKNHTYDDEDDQELNSIKELKRKITELDQASESIRVHALSMEKALKKRRERDTLLTSSIPHPQEVIKYFENYKLQTFCTWAEDQSTPVEYFTHFHKNVFEKFVELLNSTFDDCTANNEIFDYVKKLSPLHESKVNEIIHLYFPKIIEKFRNLHENMFDVTFSNYQSNFWCTNEKSKIEFFTHILLMRIVAKPMHFDFNLPSQSSNNNKLNETNGLPLTVNKIDSNKHFPISLDLQSGNIVSVIIPRLVFDEDDSTALDGLYLVQ